MSAFYNGQTRKTSGALCLPRRAVLALLVADMALALAPAGSALERCEQESDEVGLLQTTASLALRPSGVKVSSSEANTEAPTQAEPEGLLIAATDPTSTKSLLHGSDAGVTRAGPHPDDVGVSKDAELSGVSLNEAGDLAAFLTAFVTNLGMLVASFVVFMVLRPQFPLIFKSYAASPADDLGTSEPESAVLQRRKVVELAEKMGLVLEKETHTLSKTEFSQRRSEINADAIFNELTDKSGKQHSLDAELRDSSFPVTLTVAGRQRSMFAWVTAAFGTTTEQSAEVTGLDNALLLEFTDLNLRIMGLIMVPMLGVMAPLHYFCGGNAAGGDHMSYLSFGNVEVGSWLYWIHGFVVWYVVLVVFFCIDGSMKRFVGNPLRPEEGDGLRRSWLKNLDHLRAHTIMVEGIPESPENWRTDAKLKEFFVTRCNFPSDSILSANIVKDTHSLERHLHEYRRLEMLWSELQHQRNDPDKKDETETEAERKNYDDLCQAQKDMKKALEDIKDASKQGENNWGVGFVTFRSRRDVEVAKAMLFDSDSANWSVAAPPPLQDVLWTDLTQSSEGKAVYTVIGTALVIGLYLAYMPLVVSITSIATAVDLGALQPLWAGLAPTLGLQFMVGFLPTFLIMIYRSFFTLVADAYAQHQLQVAYFWFQIVFVVLITAIGDSVIEFTEAIFTDPLRVVSLMATMMPYATHFYMNFLVLQWVTHAMNLTRYVPLTKFMGFRKLWGDARAREMSEPEDQDYYGLGSRNARFTINMVIGIVYSTLSPPIALLTFLNFCVCRLVYGYLLPFAETRKPDLGGVFFVTSLSHLFVGLIIYTTMMTGVLAGRAATSGPAMIAGLTIPFVVWARMRFQTKFSWEKLSIIDACKCGSPSIQGRYEQPCFDEAARLSQTLPRPHVSLTPHRATR